MHTIFPANWFLLGALMCCLASCDTPVIGPQRGAPPVAFRYRKAQVPGKGLVAGVENTSQTETLSDFVVKVKSQDGKRSGSYRIHKTLQPEDSMTIGWVELDGWELARDDRLSLTCQQYAEAATSIVAAP